jgi:hypothetical protein
MASVIRSEPQPPDSHIHVVGYHYLQPCSGRNDASTDLIVLQWNPNRKKWFRSGNVDAVTPSVNVSGWRYVSPLDTWI